MINCSKSEKYAGIEAVYSYNKEDSIVKVVYENKSDSNYYFLISNSINLEKGNNKIRVNNRGKKEENHNEKEIIQTQPAERERIQGILVKRELTKEEIELDTILAHLVKKVYPRWSINSPVTFSVMTIPQKSKKELLYKMKKDDYNNFKWNGKYVLNIFPRSMSMKRYDNASQKSEELRMQLLEFEKIGINNFYSYKYDIQIWDTLVVKF